MRIKRGRFEVVIEGPQSEQYLQELQEAVLSMDEGMHYSSMLTTFYTDEEKKPKSEETKK